MVKRKTVVVDRSITFDKFLNLIYDAYVENDVTRLNRLLSMITYVRNNKIVKRLNIKNFNQTKEDSKLILQCVLLSQLCDTKSLLFSDFNVEELCWMLQLRNSRPVRKANLIMGNDLFFWLNYVRKLDYDDDRLDILKLYRKYYKDLLNMDMMNVQTGVAYLLKTLL